MKIGPRYKIARRLGAPVFEKTQTQKFALREGKKSKFGGKPKTDYGNQLNEKQKAKMFYCVTEKQFAKYVSEALRKTGSPTTNLLNQLEKRLDNVVWRAGIITTHRGARQAVSHGHFLVNGKRVFVPSYNVREGDVIAIREGSKNSRLFTEIENRLTEIQAPAWIKVDPKKIELTIKSGAVETQNEMFFDLGRVIEFYQR